MSKHRRVAILGKDDIDTQYRQMRNQLEGEGIVQVIKIATPQSLDASTPNIGDVLIKGISNLSLDDLPIGGISNVVAFQQKDTKAKYQLNLSLNKFNQERVKDAKTAREIQRILQKKYKVKLPSSRRYYLLKYTTYKIDSSTTIDKAQ